MLHQLLDIAPPLLEMLVKKSMCFTKYERKSEIQRLSHGTVFKEATLKSQLPCGKLYIQSNKKRKIHVTKIRNVTSELFRSNPNNSFTEH